MQAVGFEEQLAAIQRARPEDQPVSLYHLEHMRLWTKLRPYVRVQLCLENIPFHLPPAHHKDTASAVAEWLFGISW